MIAPAHRPGLELGRVRAGGKRGHPLLPAAKSLLGLRPNTANAAHLQLDVPAYNLGNFVRTLAMPKATVSWSLTSLREKLIKVGAKVAAHGHYVTSQMAEVARSATGVHPHPLADRAGADAARDSIMAQALDA